MILAHLVAVQSSEIFKNVNQIAWYVLVKFLESSRTLDSNQINKNYRFDQSKGCFENLFPMALERYEEEKILNFFLNVYSRPKVDEFSNFWEDPRLGWSVGTPQKYLFIFFCFFIHRLCPDFYNSVI